jgi:NTE family protein
MDTPSGKRKLGLALSGGATRGLAHIGVLQALEENGLWPDFISGTSIGAFAAVLYGFGVPLAKMRAVGEGMTPLRVTKLKLSRYSLFSNEELGKLIKAEIGTARLEESPIPLAIVTTDISTGEKVVLREGEAASAVMASSALAGIYLPVRINNRLLMDGGIMEDVPISPLRMMGADVVVAVNLSAQRKYRMPEDIIDILFNAFDIAIDENTKVQVKAADVLIEPCLFDFRRMDVSQIDELIAEGRRAAEESIPRIREELERPAGQASSRKDLCAE